MIFPIVGGLAFRIESRAPPYFLQYSEILKMPFVDPKCLVAITVTSCCNQDVFRTTNYCNVDSNCSMIQGYESWILGVIFGSNPR
jgi:hypothetical protein